MQRPAPLTAQNLSLRPPRLSQGRLAHDRDERVERGVQPLDAHQAILSNLNRRDFSPPQALGKLGNRREGSRHQAEPIVKPECRPPCARVSAVVPNLFSKPTQLPGPP